VIGFRAVVNDYSAVRSTEVHGWQNKLGGWLGDCFFSNDISGLRRPKNVKFGTKVASSVRTIHALRFLEKVFNYGKICKKMPFFTLITRGQQQKAALAHSELYLVT